MPTIRKRSVRRGVECAVECDHSAPQSIRLETIDSAPHRGRRLEDELDTTSRYAPRARAANSTMRARVVVVSTHAVAQLLEFRLRTASIEGHPQLRCRAECKRSAARLAGQSLTPTGSARGSGRRSGELAITSRSTSLTRLVPAPTTSAGPPQPGSRRDCRLGDPKDRCPPVTDAIGVLQRQGPGTSFEVRPSVHWTRHPAAGPSPLARGSGTASIHAA